MFSSVLTEERKNIFFEYLSQLLIKSLKPGFPRFSEAIFYFNPKHMGTNTCYTNLFMLQEPGERSADQGQRLACTCRRLEDAELSCR
jgi:hypothetical protein